VVVGAAKDTDRLNDSPTIATIEVDRNLQPGSHLSMYRRAR
jgi:hypothetical protein